MPWRDGLVQRKAEEGCLQADDVLIVQTHDLLSKLPLWPHRFWFAPHLGWHVAEQDGHLLKRHAHSTNPELKRGPQCCCDTPPKNLWIAHQDCSQIVVAHPCFLKQESHLLSQHFGRENIQDFRARRDHIGDLLPREAHLFAEEELHYLSAFSNWWYEVLRSACPELCHLGQLRWCQPKRFHQVFLRFVRTSSDPRLLHYCVCKGHFLEVPSRCACNICGPGRCTMKTDEGRAPSVECWSSSHSCDELAWSSLTLPRQQLHSRTR
mmetsp:Transcript_69443/g.160907  ORF Transcript_69443/g.160907 Transcript_69443/m.160907 type:complete len:265 (-) Transcript_69443:257-1051(-)